MLNSNFKKICDFLLFSRFFHGTPIHISRNTCDPRNIVWETLSYGITTAMLLAISIRYQNLNTII
jgi:hypothetical protein